MPPAVPVRPDAVRSWQQGREPRTAQDAIRRDRKSFLKADRTRKLVSYSALWIKGWHDVELFEREALPAAYQRLAAKNPFLSSRRELAAVAKCAGWFTNDLMVGAGLLLNKSGMPDMLEKILPGKMVNFGPQGAPAMRLKTAMGTRYAVYMHDLLSLHEEASPEDVSAEIARRKAGNLPTPKDPDWGDRRFLNSGVGKQLALTVPELVKSIIDRNIARHVPLACHDLLKAAGVTEPVTQVGWMGIQARFLIGEVSWLMRASEDFYTMILSRDAITLYRRGSDKPVARVTHEMLERRVADLQD